MTSATGAWGAEAGVAPAAAGAGTGARYRPALLTDSADRAVAEAAELLGGWGVEVRPARDLAGGIPALPEARAVVVTTDNPNALREVFAEARHAGVPVVVGCADETGRRRAAELRADDWYFVPATAEEVAARVRTAIARAQPNGAALTDRIERAEYEQMLYDARTGLPTLPVAIERSRAHIKERGEVVVLYLNFVRYSKLEEIYGWEKLDAVLETTAETVREILAESALSASRASVSFTNDADLVLLHVPAPGAQAATDAEIHELASRLERRIAQRLDAAHGDEVAALFDIYVGVAHVYFNPKMRLERLIYRGIREAAMAAKSVEERERARKVADLRTSLRDRLVYVDYHPIVETESRRIFGYEALARGNLRSLRSPEVMFEVAAEADLLWELGRLCRARAIEEMRRLQGDELLFLNVDPHDFADPAFSDVEIGVDDPRRVVIEITERTAIKDYPKFRERLRAFRDAGFRFAVDDAGSGYAGLGSIANLEPDFIKLDMSLINCIDTNFIKQNLVETMVKFARDHGAMVIAEGVERVEEFETVKALGVPLVQGFYLHRPR
ncbi:EAL domain-containing protein [Roseisolibacter sp. H3M3-2]|uniref:EAL domain-containing protein n=1 Tax=Roseisolibacter sp. H3M3-2 TaxID=3031323 RepID=UPI0023DCAB96|nr:EAL domain-containing protein [Roseisolibacter sp. H3M3-2]MDF1501985.1 EAL domain-containing protein [Roseisolibacter sp. H3M3-2]